MRMHLLALLGIAFPVQDALAGDVSIRFVGTVSEDGYATGPMSSAGIGSLVELRLEVDLPGFAQPGPQRNYDLDAATFEVFIDGAPVLAANPLTNPVIGVTNDLGMRDQLRSGVFQMANGDAASFWLIMQNNVFGSEDLTTLYGSYALPPVLTFDQFEFSGPGGLLEIAPLALEIFPVGAIASGFCFGDGGDQAGCTDCPCGNTAPQGSNGGCLNSVGGSAQILSAGQASLSSDSLRFTLARGAPNTFAILSSGDAQAPANSANPCFGSNSGITATAFDGLRCVVQGVQRHGTRMTDSLGNAGSVTPGWGTPDGPALGILAQGGFTSGQTRHFQVIYRDDPAAGCGTGQNTTPGVTVTVVP